MKDSGSSDDEEIAAWQYRWSICWPVLHSGGQFDAAGQPCSPMITAADMAAAPAPKPRRSPPAWGNRGAILTNEFRPAASRALHANISRCGIANTARLTHFDGRVFGAALPEHVFDAILLMRPAPAKARRYAKRSHAPKLVARK